MGCILIDFDNFEIEEKEFKFECSYALNEKMKLEKKTL